MTPVNPGVAAFTLAVFVLYAVGIEDLRQVLFVPGPARVSFAPALIPNSFTDLFVFSGLAKNAAFRSINPLSVLGFTPPLHTPIHANLSRWLGAPASV